MSGWQAIVFDLDDTLYPERECVLSGLKSVADWAEEQFGHPAHATFAEFRRLFESGVRGNTFNQWLDGHGLDHSAWAPLMVEVYRQHVPQISPYPNARSLLGRLGRRYALGLVSDGYLDVQRKKLEALNLASCFGSVVFSDSLGRDAWKPSPRPFALVLEQLGAEPFASVYVGDNPAKDFRGARCAGMRSIRVRHADGLHCRCEPATPEDAPDWEASDLDEIEAVLTANEGNGRPGRVALTREK